MTDLFTHWIDVVHWAMKSDQAHEAQMLGDKYVFEQWDCPDTIQAAFRYPGFDVVYEGMMSSSIDDGGLEFRGTDATLKLDRERLRGLSRRRARRAESGAQRTQLPRRHHLTHGELLRLREVPQRAERARGDRGRRRPRRTHRQPRLPPRRPEYVAAEGLNWATSYGTTGPRPVRESRYCDSAPGCRGPAD